MTETATNKPPAPDVVIGWLIDRATEFTDTPGVIRSASLAGWNGAQFTVGYHEWMWWLLPDLAPEESVFFDDGPEPASATDADRQAIRRPLSEHHHEAMLRVCGLDVESYEDAVRILHRRREAQDMFEAERESRMAGGEYEHHRQQERERDVLAAVEAAEHGWGPWRADREPRRSPITLDDMTAALCDLGGRAPDDPREAAELNETVAEWLATVDESDHERLLRLAAEQVYMRARVNQLAAMMHELVDDRSDLSDDE